MKLVGKSKGSCCDDKKKIVFEVDLDSPRIQK
jgi:hypothetical protein